MTVPPSLPLVLEHLEAAGTPTEALAAARLALEDGGGWVDVAIWGYGAGPLEELPEDAPDVVRRARRRFGSTATQGDEVAVAVRVDGTPIAVLSARRTDVDDAALEELAMVARVTGLACTGALAVQRRLALATEAAALNQVMEGVAAASTAADVATAVLVTLVRALRWDCGLVVRLHPTGPDAEGTADADGGTPAGDVRPQVLATLGLADADRERLIQLARGPTGLRGVLAREQLPGGPDHAVVWPIQQDPHTLLVLAGTAPSGVKAGPAAVLGPIAQTASLARAGLERLQQLAQQQRAQDAEAANRAKSDFLSRMSHELRTPLNAVLGFAQLLQGEDLDEDALESIGQIRSAGQHLLELVNEVLDISRIEAGRMTLSLEPQDLRSLVGECHRMVLPLAERRGIAIVVDEPSVADRWVTADRQRLRQVLLNLLSNAIKYNRADGTVTIRVEPDAEPPGDDHVCIAVTDTGHGIPPEAMDRLFVPFDRLGADQGGQEGTGLGLALSERLVDAMRGRLTAVSTVGEGTTFRVSLPTAAPIIDVTAPPPVTVAVQPPPVQGTVIYIEDNLPNVLLVERILARRAGIQVLHAQRGETGIELARQVLPDLILLDLDLPDLHGSEVLATLQEDRTTRSIPVVVISADVTMTNTGQSGPQPVTRLTKPLDIPAFLSVVDHILSVTLRVPFRPEPNP